MTRNFPKVSILDTEVHCLHSDIIQDDFELWIAKPQAGFGPKPSEPPTVLYVLDANLFFGITVEMTRIMYKFYGELPPILVVGIAYPTEDGFLQGILRNRDFTPSEDAGLTEMTASIPNSERLRQTEWVTGGANHFLRFLQEEVKPFLASRYEIASVGSTLFGSSLGGLFVMYAMLSEPTIFDKFIAVSPALWWDSEMIFQMEQSQTEGNRDSDKFAVGGLEEAPEIAMLEQFKMITNAKRMTHHLNEREVQVYLEILEGETHTSVVPVALTRGLRTLP